ncbi:hypothetical protein C8F04DRAFT_1199008 [Mycena alexandri]|uniref:DUF6570 domain-containing protein n=1 Tax=Mycena alexandri TaxID=1745969 RepID=A0AAD6WLD8_9AGAR|nr:hypothetical protein C8F04DRAFT_1199008 [Mycena alexandri]
MGKCASHDGYSFSCSAVEFEFSDCAVDTALRRLLKLHDVPFVDSDKTKKLRRRLKSYLTRLRSSKQFEAQFTSSGIARAAHATESARLRAQWLQLIPDHLKKKPLRNFNYKISRDNLATFVCGSCTEEYPAKSRKRADRFINIHAPEQPDDDDNMSVDSDVESRSRALPPDDFDLNASTLDSNRNSPVPSSVPPLSGVNKNYLGPVPPELQNLTVVEEAMIALCRAKCWIV